MGDAKRSSDLVDVAQIADHILKKQKLNGQLSNKADKVDKVSNDDTEKLVGQSEHEINNDNVVVSESTENAIDPVFGVDPLVKTNKEDTEPGVEEEKQQGEEPKLEQEGEPQQEQNHQEQIHPEQNKTEQQSQGLSNESQSNSKEVVPAVPVADSTETALVVSNKISTTDPEMLAKIKKLNHKEVERRRRENINIALRELQEVVPTTHSNKAQVIRKAVEHIQKLKENEENLVNKWTLEKIITDQAINELANSNDKLKLELGKAYREIEHRKNIFENFVELVSKQENSTEIEEFLSRVNDLFLNDDIDEGDDGEGEEEEGEEEEDQEHGGGDQITNDQQIDERLKSNDQQIIDEESTENASKDDNKA